MSKLIGVSGLIVGVLWLTGGSAYSQSPDAASVEFFEAKIRPVLVEHCHACHSSQSQPLRGNLRVDRRVLLLQGGDLGAAIVPGKPDESLLLKAISHREPDLQMPLGKPKLADSIIDNFRDWIAKGAVWPADDVPVEKADGFDVAARKQDLPWIWKAPVKHSPPPVKQTDWAQTSIDAFLLHRLEEAGLKPAPEAPSAIWLRRVYFALIGLPPTPQALAAFQADSGRAARERVVDELLALPQFGERWARHWLDLVRYAESRGHESDFIIPNAYEYRDYVIRALNADLPYDEFVREHLAGDLLPHPRRHPKTGSNESIIATGWAFLGEEIHAPVDTRLDETERIDNRIDVLSKTFLGLTVSCARCHDHKFDAISQRDYYALAGYFISTGQRLARFESIEQEKAADAQLAEFDTAAQPALKAALHESLSELSSNVGSYLRAAVVGLKSAGLPAPEAGKRITSAEFTEPTRAALGKLAVEAGISPQRLEYWVASLWNAATDRHDLLHLLARAALATDLPREPAVSDALELGLAEGMRTVVDFGSLSPADWSADGLAFGSRPYPAGTLQFVPGAEGSPPSVRLFSLPAASTHLDWKRLELAPGNEREPTLYGGWIRDGAMLRSPKFELKTGRLHYLVRGSGRVFAAVDSQRLLTGPIHTGLVREWGFDDRWRWESHDLSAYAGHRVALEFSPSNEFDTSIARIVESDQVPAEPVTAGRFAVQVATTGQVEGLEPVLKLYQELVSSAVHALKSGAARRGELETARWLLKRPELLTGKVGTWPEAVAHKLATQGQFRESLLAEIPRQSRTVPAMLDGNGVDEYLLVRGKHQRTKGTVPRRSLEALGGTAPHRSLPGSGRLDLAREFTNPQHPLVARVLVNRVWHHLFGCGIVATVDNFGVLGMRPTHPELLDDLAATFVADDHWSLKQLIRRLVLSRAFAMSSDPADAAAEECDPENLLLHRMHIKRLEGEVIRDAILAVSGRLDLRLYGPSVPLHASQFIEARGLRGERGPLDGDGRRSIYVSARRNFLPTMMIAFDTPTPFTTVGRRNISNVPGQMLFLMNDPFVHQQAEFWARRLRTEAPDLPAEVRVRGMFLAALAREPGSAETEQCMALVRDAAQLLGTDPSRPEAWAELCQALFAVKEFLFVR
ncbi:MAG: PSD1 domain-containing protein [Planctomycetes bacterium]|nr:PSD1 domain-containing protein [Planctomycetota bacterium]